MEKLVALNLFDADLCLASQIIGVIQSCFLNLRNISEIQSFYALLPLRKLSMRLSHLCLPKPDLSQLVQNAASRLNQVKETLYLSLLSWPPFTGY